MQIDFERCESDYPELCSAYSKYVAEKQKNRRGVSQHRTITVEEIKETDDMWTINEPAYWTINIYGSYDDYIETSKEFTLEQRYLNAICWYFAEVNNGGHHQFFYNSTGIVWEDTLVGLRLFNMKELADNFQSVLDFFGGTVPLIERNDGTYYNNLRIIQNSLIFSMKKMMQYIHMMVSLKMYLYMRTLIYLYLMEPIRFQTNFGDIFS